ncbi:MAG: cupin domain-containing protein [Chloroflexota bacterium]|nr:cupin domain-containing protein [Chloroflexota bacterium]
MNIRRVVTGHSADGKAILDYDDIIEFQSRRPGTGAGVIWTTEGFPVSNQGREDTKDGATGTTLPNGTVFRIVEFGPGNAPRLHRTDSVDYAVVMSGEIDMELDDGASVHLKAGDVLVQRGTVHNWVNRGTEPCRIAFVLIDAKPVEVDGKAVAAFG